MCSPLDIFDHSGNCLDMNLSVLEHNLFLLLFSAAAVHSIFLCFIILAKSRKEPGLQWLGILMIPIALWLLTYLFHLSGLIFSYPHLLGIFGPLLYLTGPLYFLFIRRSLNQNANLKWLDFLHIIPAIYVLWEWWPVYFDWSTAVKLAAIERMHSHDKPNLWQLVKANRMLFLILAYIIAASLVLQRRLHQGPSNTKRVRWLLKFSMGFGVVLLLLMFLPLVFLNLPGINAAVIELLFVAILAISIHTLGYVALSKEEILPALDLPNPTIKYTTSPLNAAEIELKKQAILRYLDTESPWADPNFSISELSTDLGIPKHHISQILNEGLQKSFYELICQYRVEAIKQRLKAGDVETYSILGIAKDCGFGSKSSFNRAFKKMTGMTPTEWMKVPD